MDHGSHMFTASTLLIIMIKCYSAAAATATNTTWQIDSGAALAMCYITVVYLWHAVELSCKVLRLLTF